MLNQENQEFIFIGSNKLLLEIPKIFINFNFYQDMSVDEIQEIIELNIGEKTNFFYISKSCKVNREQLIQYIFDYKSNKLSNNAKNILLIEDNEDIILNQKIALITKEKLIKLICKHFEIEINPDFYQIENSIYDTIYQYNILGQMPHIINSFDNVEIIPFLRKKLFSLNRTTQSYNKREFLKTILFRLEYSFKLTGLKGIFAYYLIIEKFI